MGGAAVGVAAGRPSSHIRLNSRHWVRQSPSVSCRMEAAPSRVKKKPDSGGVTRLPSPQPMKNREESRPVMFFFLAT